MTQILALIAKFLIQLLAGPAAAREAGKQEGRIDQLQTENTVKDEQLEIASRPRADDDATLQRMRNGGL